MFVNTENNWDMYLISLNNIQPDGYSVGEFANLKIFRSRKIFDETYQIKVTLASTLDMGG